MIDFLRANTWCSREEYLWEMTVPQVQLASCDFTHIDYDRRRAARDKKSSGKHKTRTMSSAEMLRRNMTDNGTPIITKK